ncbi:MAG: hypothetical protein KGO49_10570 [Gammaproteobacteria bacterium]|nr:hypothetical protein [Gammaproteobacteria bacterium]
MKANDQKLIKDIVIVLIIKLILLYGIWFYWVSGRTVKVDASSAATHMLSTSH